MIPADGFLHARDSSTVSFFLESVTGHLQRMAPSLLEVLIVLPLLCIRRRAGDADEFTGFGDVARFRERDEIGPFFML